MAFLNKKYFDKHSAYGQLIILVFVPIMLLAIVGAVLVYYETMNANKNEQEALAKALLIRYQPQVQAHLPEIMAEIAANSENQATENPPTENSLTKNQATENKQQVSHPYLRNILYTVQTGVEPQRVAIINESGKVLQAEGYGAEESWGVFSDYLQYQQSNQRIENQLSSQPASMQSIDFIPARKTDIGTSYGMALGEYEGQKLWLFIDMDSQPLKLAQYRILMALLVTGLLTILLLLLSLNSYASSWLEPVYRLRLHLQGTTVNNLYKPIPVKAKGELMSLQHDLAQTFRRLHRSYQELQSHAEQTEDDLRQAFDEMEMQNISIRNARDLAVSSSQAKSAFLANISHELRTPLNSIDGFSNLLARSNGVENLSPEQALYVQTIRKSSAHLLALVNDVLDFSKIEAGKLVLDSHEFDLYETIYDVVDMLSPVASEKGLRLAVLFYNDVPLNIVGDALRMKQVMTNLVANAIKFTEVGDVLVTVKLDEEKDNYLHISIQDSGRGIDEDNRKQLFKTFSQGDPSITRQYGGTGLGLVISQQLTRLMGGEIGYFDNDHANIAPHGSTFWFSMPTHVDVLEVENASDIALPVLNQQDDKDLQMLVWINHPVSLQVLQASLQPLPIHITPVHSISGALDLLREEENRWDWVLIDGGLNSKVGESEEDLTAMLKQVRLSYQGRLAVYGYQVALDMQLLSRYQAHALYEPLDKRQLYNMLSDNRNKNAKAMAEVPRWHGYRVLAVDDHHPNLLVLQALLEEQGIEVVTAGNGFDAIEIISKQNQNIDGTSADKPIDLIFMDIQMPRMSGHQAAEEIRRIDNRTPRIPIIALTAHAMADERDKLIRSGIDDYVGKPISQSQLLQILQKWLGKKAPQVVIEEPAINDVVTRLASRYHEAKEVEASTTDINVDTSSMSSTSSENEQHIIDWEDALVRSANKPNLAAQLIIMMIDSVEEEKTALQTAWQNSDREQLAQIAHRILGASRYAGVPQLRHASQTFEDMSLDLVGYTNISELQTAYDSLMQALDNLANADLSPWAELKYHRFKEDEMTWKMI